MLPSCFSVSEVRFGISEIPEICGHAHLNRVLHGQITGFVTCTAAFIGANGNMTLANAGNLPPYCNGKELNVESGLPLGITPDVCYLFDRAGRTITRLSCPLAR
jgi:serine phosphatase RsbU (regulator of sigma subunit)